MMQHLQIIFGEKAKEVLGDDPYALDGLAMNLCVLANAEVIVNGTDSISIDEGRMIFKKDVAEQMVKDAFQSFHITQEGETITIGAPK